MTEIADICRDSCERDATFERIVGLVETLAVEVDRYALLTERIEERCAASIHAELSLLRD